jgi:hypothetical protein
MSKRLKVIREGHIRVTFGPITGPAALAVLVYAIVQFVLNVLAVLR